MKKLFFFVVICWIYFFPHEINSQTTRFAIIGDYGLSHRFNIPPYPQDSGNKKVSSMVKGWQQSDTNFFIITVGDNNYPNGNLNGMDGNIGEYYHSYIRPRVTGLHINSGGPEPYVKHNRFFPAMGNHDFYNDTGYTVDCHTFGCPYYMYFPIDSFKNAGPGAERYYDYLQGDIRFFVVNSAKGDDIAQLVNLMI